MTQFDSVPPRMSLRQRGVLAWKWLVASPLSVLFGASMLLTRDHAGDEVLVRARIRMSEFSELDRKRVYMLYERVRVRLGGRSVHSLPLGIAAASLVVVVMFGRSVIVPGSLLKSLTVVGIWIALLGWWWARYFLRRSYLIPGDIIPGNVDEIAIAWLAERHCPSCLYDLAQTDPGDSGLTRCPECAHQWRVGGATTIPRERST